MSWRVALVLCGVACSEIPFELISLPGPGPGDAGSSSESDAGADAGAPCLDFDQPLGVRFSQVALVPARPLPIVLGIGNGTLTSVRLRDGGVDSRALLSGVSSTHFNAIPGTRGGEVAFHAPAPSFARLDADGQLEGAAISVLAPRQGANPGWGLRISGDGTRTVVVYRTLGAEAAFTVVGPSERTEAVVPFSRLGHLDGVLADDRVVLLGVTEAGLERRVFALDGGALAAPELLSVRAEGRPFACPTLTAWTERDVDGGTHVEVSSGGARWSLGEGALGAGTCAATGALLSLVTPGSLRLERVALMGPPVAPLSVPTLDDHALLHDDDGVWVVLAPRFEPEARLVRRCARR